MAGNKDAISFAGAEAFVLVSQVLERRGRCVYSSEPFQHYGGGEC